MMKRILDAIGGIAMLVLMFVIMAIAATLGRQDKEGSDK